MPPHWFEDARKLVVASLVRSPPTEGDDITAEEAVAAVDQALEELLPSIRSGNVCIPHFQGLVMLLRAQAARSL